MFHHQQQHIEDALPPVPVDNVVRTDGNLSFNQEVLVLRSSFNIPCSNILVRRTVVLPAYIVPYRRLTVQPVFFVRQGTGYSLPVPGTGTG
jgi:hypothetical protein